MNKFYRRLLEIFWYSSWSNQDLINSLLVIAIGINLCSTSLFYSPHNKSWAVGFIVFGIFSLLITLWNNKPSSTLILFSRMVCCFCLWLNLFINNFNEHLLVFFILTLNSSWCVFRTNTGTCLSKIKKHYSFIKNLFHISIN